MRDPNLNPSTALRCTKSTTNPAVKFSTPWLPAFLMGILGAVMLLFPMEAGVSFACLMTVGMYLYGISECVMFFRTPKEQRSGWTLANGLLMFSLGGLFFWSAFESPFGVLQMMITMAFFAGFLSCSVGFSQITAYFAQPPGETAQPKWLLIGGIGNLILGMMAFLMPLLGWFTLVTVWGAYLLASAVTAAAASVSQSHRDAAS